MSGVVTGVTGLPDLGARTDEIIVFAGPCAVESQSQLDAVAECIAAAGLRWLRGGAFKPRTNPHSFQGLGEEGLEMLAISGQAYGLKTLTEVMDSAQCATVASFVDGLQIGARNCQNYSLLQTIGHLTARDRKFVLYKRGLATSISEWLNAVEYLAADGNDNIMLCERGLRTFETATRFTLDIAAVPVVHKLSLWPICVDVSHAAGTRDLVPPLAQAAIAAGADALMVEVHPDPAHAKSDSAQQLTLAQFTDMIADLRKIAAVFGKKLV